MKRLCLVGEAFQAGQEGAAFTSRPEHRQLKCLQETFEVSTFGLDASRETIRESRPSAVIVNSLSRSAVRIAWMGVPYVFVAHDGFLDRPWLRRRSARQRAALWFVLRRAARVVALSTTDAEALRRVSTRPDRVVLLPNPLEACRYRLEGAPTPPVDVLFVGHLGPEKGLEILLEALRLLELRGHRPLSLRCVSFHTDEERRAIERHAARIQLQAQPVFIQGVPLEELQSHLRSASVYVAPSFAEAQSTVLEEALVVGTPSVASRVGSAPELLPPQALCSPGNSHELAIVLEAALRESPEPTYSPPERWCETFTALVGEVAEGLL